MHEIPIDDGRHWSLTLRGSTQLGRSNERNRPNRAVLLYNPHATPHGHNDSSVAKRRYNSLLENAECGFAQRDLATSRQGFSSV